ncbi:zinc-ribbon domain-containing protein [Ponticoccus gilvus]|nr:zinc-ribbon domain-containing protein [Enemella evansiae]
MRLICPNCGAQYDVPVDVIPEAGRDVQCSNCGHTWFQRHPDEDADLAEDLEQPIPDPAWEPEDEDEPAPAPPVDAPEPQRRIDPEIAEIFREEREYENRRRSAETLESQPDLGLTEPDEDEQARRSRQARERMAKMRGSDTPAPSTPRPDEAEDGGTAMAAAAAAAAGSRRDLLPDVDEINQSLRSNGVEARVVDSAKDETARRETEETRRGGGFGKGFLTMVVLVGGAVALYAFAPAIADRVPALAPLLDSYVTAVDQARNWLDGQVTALLTTLDSMSSEAQTEGPETTAPETTPPAEPAPEGN